MKQIMRTPENCSFEDALHVVCCAEEIACADIFVNLFNILYEDTISTSNIDTIIYWLMKGYSSDAMRRRS